MQTEKSWVERRLDENYCLIEEKIHEMTGGKNLMAVWQKGEDDIICVSQSTYNQKAIKLKDASGNRIQGIKRINDGYLLEIDLKTFDFGKHSSLLSELINENDMRQVGEYFGCIVHSIHPASVYGGISISHFWDAMTLPNKQFKMTGDIFELYNPNDKRYRICTLVDTQDTQQSIRIYIPDATEIHPTGEDLQEKKNITVIGRPIIYKSQIQLNAKKIIVNGEGKINWEKDCEELLHTKSQKNNAKYLRRKLSSAFEENGHIKIALIATRGKGYADFIELINKKLVRISNEEDSLVEKMTAKNIINRINEIRQKASYDCICITRGGGDSENLIDFNKPELAKTICECEEIPIITGIGHSSDEFLCDRAAWVSAKTPTDAAKKINEFVNHIKMILDGGF